MAPETDLRTQTAQALVECARRIRARGLCEATSGNFSAVVGRSPVRLLITPSGRDKGRVRPEDLLLVGEDGRPVEGDAGEPSAETPLHVCLVDRAGAGAVLHTHSIWGTLLGERFQGQDGFVLRGYEMLKGIDGIRSHDESIFVPVFENTQDMAGLALRVEQMVIERPQARGFLIAGHGLYAWGADVEQAYRHVEAFEFLFELAGRRLPTAPFTGQ